MLMSASVPAARLRATTLQRPGSSAVECVTVERLAHRSTYTSRWVPSGAKTSCVQDVYSRKLAAEDWCGIRADHILEHARVHRAEVGIELQVAVVVEVAQ